MRFASLLVFVWAAAAAPKPTVRELTELARGNPARLKEAITAAFPAEELKKGIAVLGDGPDFVWAVEAAKPPALYVDDQALGAMKPVKGTALWFHSGKLKTGTSHAYYYVIDDARFGGRTDVPAYPPDCYPQPGVPQGALSDKLVHTSRIYEGMKSDYWIYVPAQYDAKTPAALMVWQDGEGHIRRDGAARTLNVVDNLIHQKKIPVMVLVLISPGLVGEKRMRSIEYDSVTDRYPSFLRDEILPDVYAKYNIRRDGYSRVIAGNSSGGICSFNAAWRQPDQFSRVLSRIGSFTSIAWNNSEPQGGDLYPFKVRKEPKRNIRVWMQDGSEDLENTHGSWPLQNIQLANSLKMAGYDFHFSFGNGTHNGAHGNSELPEALVWLWRDYDPSKTEQVYEMEPAERQKPMFRVKIYNR